MTSSNSEPTNNLNLNPSLPSGGDGFGFYYEDGHMVILNPGSGQLCNPGGLTGWIEARDKNSTETKQTERAELTKAARKQKAEDIRVLGPLYGELATLIRKNMAAAKRRIGKPVGLKRKRRRRFKPD